MTVFEKSIARAEVNLNDDPGHSQQENGGTKRHVCHASNEARVVQIAGLSQ